jgi:hypothetical protein
MSIRRGGLPSPLNLQTLPGNPIDAPRHESSATASPQAWLSPTADIVNLGWAGVITTNGQTRWRHQRERSSAGETSHDIPPRSSNVHPECLHLAHRGVRTPRGQLCRDNRRAIQPTPKGQNLFGRRALVRGQTRNRRDVPFPRRPAEPHLETTPPQASSLRAGAGRSHESSR